MATAIITTKYCNANALQSLISDKNERYFWKQKKLHILGTRVKKEIHPE